MNRDILDKIYQSNRNVSDGLRCVFCKKILLHPQQSKCGHRSCKICLKNATKIGSVNCPKCNAIMENIQYDYAALRDINELVVTCPMDCCIYKDKLSKLSEHVSNCAQLEMVEIRSKVKDGNVDNSEMKQNISKLMKEKDQMNQLIDTAQRNENCLNDFSDEILDNYKKIERSMFRFDSENPGVSEDYAYLRNDLNELRDSYKSLEEYMKSLNIFNKQIKESVTKLYSKLENLEEEKVVNFRQFYEDIEYLTNEFSIIKTTNEKKVVKFYNRLSRYSDKLNKVATKLPELYSRINNLKRKLADVKENHIEYEQSEISELESQMCDTDKEIESVKETIVSLHDLYPDSVFVTVYFQENIGMNMSLPELEIFCNQFESSMATIRKEITQTFGSNRSIIMKGKRQLMRRPAFSMSDRKRKSESKIIDEV